MKKEKGRRIILKNKRIMKEDKEVKRKVNK